MFPLHHGAFGGEGRDDLVAPERKIKHGNVDPLWQKLIWAVMFLVVCEGAVRKWVIPGLQAEIYLVKDALLVLAYVGFLSSRLPTGIHLKAMAGLKTLLMFSLVYFAIASV